MEEKQQQLFSLLRDMGRVIVAYSGGTDSAYLAWAANRALGDQSVAITADSASIPESHKRDAIEFARQFGIRHELIPTHEFENPDYLKNDANRCFHCKDELFDRLEEVGKERGIEHIVYGVNMDDIKKVENGEEELKALGFRQFRVRFHGDIVRIEISRDEMEKAFNLEMAGKFTAIFK